MLFSSQVKQSLFLPLPRRLAALLSDSNVDKSNHKSSSSERRSVWVSVNLKLSEQREPTEPLPPVRAFCSLHQADHQESC